MSRKRARHADRIANGPHHGEALVNLKQVGKAHVAAQVGVHSFVFDMNNLATMGVYYATDVTVDAPSYGYPRGTDEMFELFKFARVVECDTTVTIMLDSTTTAVKNVIAVAGITTNLVPDALDTIIDCLETPGFEYRLLEGGSAANHIAKFRFVRDIKKTLKMSDNDPLEQEYATSPERRVVLQVKIDTMDLATPKTVPAYSIMVENRLKVKFTMAKILGES